MFFVIISISIYNFGIYLILVLSNCNAIQSTDCHVRYFNKLSIIYHLSSIKKRNKDFWNFGVCLDFTIIFKCQNYLALSYYKISIKRCFESKSN